jgi:signal transduction histidine kinase
MTARSVEQRTARWPWLVLAVFAVAAMAGLPLSVLNGTGALDDVPFVVAFGAFGVVGALILSRDRGNRIGILFLWVSLAAGAGFACGELATYLYDRGSRDGSVVTAAAIVGEATWIVGILPTLVLLPLLFPNGALPSRRWRPVLWLLVVALAVVFLGFVLGSPTVSGSADRVRVPNPGYVPAFSGLADLAETFFFWTFIAILAAAVTSLVLRFRRSHGLERQQIKWFALAVVFLVVAMTISEILFAFGIESILVDILLVAPAFLSLPAAAGIAVLRYRLYDLDVVVRKTLLYGLLVAIATVVYVVVVVGVGTIVGGESPFLTIVAAAIVAIGFQPARARLSHVANRIVYGRRATPYEVLTEFSDRVGDAYAADDVLPRMARIIGQGVGAERAEVWLRIGDELRVSATWPNEEGRSAERLQLVDGALPPIEGSDIAYPVEHRGELLGALAVEKPASEPVSPNDAKLVGTLASHAGLVLRNVRLTEELRARLDDLRAAQRRIVSAQDEERRRLERNIHDGAQQQLVALTVKARLARQLAERDPAKAAELLSQIEVETQAALEDLRDLARGIYPPLLADQGLEAALRAQTRKVSLPVSVEADGVGRYAPEVEATVYFCALEALQNVTKYAAASTTTVRLSQRNGSLAFVVEDDGRGFDPRAASGGSGLQGMADRLAAVGGSLEVDSEPGRGTTVRGRVPIVTSGGTG